MQPHEKQNHVPGARSAPSLSLCYISNNLARFMPLKRKSTEMEDANWIALEKVAARCGCTYGGKPSWRRLLTLIARGVLAVSVRDKVRVHEIRKRKEWTLAELDARAERDRLRQEKIRRAAGIPPRGAQEALDKATGCRDESGMLTDPG